MEVSVFTRYGPPEVLALTEVAQRVLTPNGRMVFVSFKMKQLGQVLWTKLCGGQRVLCILTNETPEHLAFIKGLIEDGKLKPCVDRVFPLGDAAAAHAYAASAAKKGNIAITVP